MKHKTCRKMKWKDTTIIDGTNWTHVKANAIELFRIFSPSNTTAPVGAGGRLLLALRAACAAKSRSEECNDDPRV
jgi:hypothetical protein